MVVLDLSRYRKPLFSAVYLLHPLSFKIRGPCAEEHNNLSGFI